MKTLIFTHADTDGICSGALALAANRPATVFFTSPVAVIDEIKRAGRYDRIIICDIAINIATAESLKKILNSLATERELIYIDHHPLPEGFSAPWLIHDQEASGSLLTFSYFRDLLDPDLSRVAMYGAIADYRDDSPLANELVHRWDKRSLYYYSGTLSQGIEMERKNYNYKRDLVLSLSENIIPTKLGDLVENAVIASNLEEELRTRVEQEVVRMNNLSYIINPEGFIAKAAIYARIYGNTPVGIAAEYRETHHSYDISVRSEGDLNLNRLLNDSAVKYGGHGGGHPQAGGGRIPEDKLIDFLEDLDIAIGNEIGKK